MKTDKKAKSNAYRIAIIVITMIILLSLSSPAFAHDYEKDENPFLDDARIIDAINTVNKEFPEANLSVDDALEEANLIKEYSYSEILLYLKTLFAAGPKETFVRKDVNGDIAVLDVFSPLVQASHGFNLGSPSVSGYVTTYTGTKVWANGIYAILFTEAGGYAEYYIDHYYNSALDSGWVTNTYGLYYTGGARIYLTGASIVQGSGAYSAVEYECTENDPFTGILTYLGHVELRFYATPFNTSLSYTG